MRNYLLENWNKPHLSRECPLRLENRKFLTYCFTRDTTSPVLSTFKNTLINLGPMVIIYTVLNLDSNVYG